MHVTHSERLKTLERDRIEGVLITHSIKVDNIMATRITIAVVTCILLTGVGFTLFQAGEAITQLANSIGA